MIRHAKRTLRQWRRELDAFWRKFNTFKRTAIGIVIAMIIVYAARIVFLDAQTEIVAELSEELEGSPALIPDPEDDDEVISSEITIESLDESLKEWRKRIDQARGKLGDTSRAGAMSALLTLEEEIGKRGLRFERRPLTGEENQDDDFPLERIRFSYRVVGRFQAVHDLLHALDGIPGICRIENMSLEVQDNGSGEPNIVFHFHFTSMYVN